MKLQIQNVWSPDLNPPSTGSPPDDTDFEILVQVAIGAAGHTGREVFSLRVCSPSALARVEPGTFITSTLVLGQFSWTSLRHRLDRLLAQSDDCRDWVEAIQRLSGSLLHNDAA
jgi:hypothetical protein